MSFRNCAERSFILDQSRCASLSRSEMAAVQSQLLLCKMAKKKSGWENCFLLCGKGYSCLTVPANPEWLLSKGVKNVDGSAQKHPQIEPRRKSLVLIEAHATGTVNGWNEKNCLKGVGTSHWWLLQMHIQLYISMLGRIKAVNAHQGGHMERSESSHTCICYFIVHKWAVTVGVEIVLT